MNKKLTDPQIVEKLLFELRMNKNKFGKEIGYASGTTIHHILNGRYNISSEFITKVLTRFPDVNYEFLKSGTGNVLKTKLSEMNVNKNLLWEKSDDQESASIPARLDSIEANLRITQSMLKRQITLIEKLLAIMEK